MEKHNKLVGTKQRYVILLDSLENRNLVWHNFIFSSKPSAISGDAVFIAT